MGRKKIARDPQEELEIESKLLIDEATNLMKLHNYTKAMTIYQKVTTLSYQHNLRSQGVKLLIPLLRHKKLRFPPITKQFLTVHELIVKLFTELSFSTVDFHMRNVRLCLY